MTKIEITDDMVKRGCDWYYGPDSLFTARETMRKILEVALNPPPEPEVVVTEEMLAAGNSAYHKWFGNGRPCLEVYGHVYVAMKAKELKSVQICEICSGLLLP